MGVGTSNQHAMMELGFAGFLAHKAIAGEHNYNELEGDPRQHDDGGVEFVVRNGVGGRYEVKVRYLGGAQ